MKTKRRQRRFNHGRSGESDIRGNNKDRAARKRFLLSLGNGKTVPCVHCGKRLDYDTVTADRIVPGVAKGRYRRENILPSCRRCNSADGHVVKERNRTGGYANDEYMTEAEKAEAMFKNNPRRKKYKSRFNPSRRFLKIKRRRSAA